MPKFIKKPVAVEAEQWFPGKEVAGVHEPIPGELPHHYVMTAHKQIVFLEPGDWVIPEPDGRGYYPCKPDILEATYDPVPDNAAATHQPPPTPGKVDIWPLVVADIESRVEAGKQKYGTVLQSHNGRDPLWDAYQEAIDLVMYLRQAIAEKEAREVAMKDGLIAGG